MSFLFPWLLGALAALAIPVIIHLLNRSRFKLVEWGAMRFLRQALVKSSRRLRFAQLALLALRVGVLAALVLAAARPRVEGGLFFAERGGGSLWLLLDLSASAGAGGAGGGAGEPAARLQRRVDEILRAVPLGEALRLFAVGDQGLLPLHEGVIYDREQARAVLARARPLPVRADLGRGLAEAALRLERENAPRPRRVLVATDFQAVSCAPPAAPPPAELEVLFLDVGPARAESLGVLGIRLAPPLLFAGQAARVCLRVRNGASAARQAAVAVLLDGEKKGVAAADLEPGETRELDFLLRLPAPGEHLLAAELPRDELAADDVRQFVFRVPESVPLAALDGSSARRPLGGELDYFLAALGARPGQGCFQVRRLRPGACNPADLGEARVILAGDVRALAEGELAALRTQVLERGAGLLVAVGGRSDREAWNATGLLPARLARREEREASPRAEELGSGPLAGLDPETRRQLGQIKIRALTVAEPEPEAQVLARAGDDPWIIAGRRGRGRVVLVTTDLDADDSDLVGRGESFVPLALALGAYLAGLDAGRANLAAGETISRPAREGDAPLVVVDPAGRTGEVRPARDEAGNWRYAYTDTLATGLYRLGDERFAVALAAAESDLEPLPAARREAFLAALHARLLENEEAPALLATEGGLTRPLLWLLLAFLAAECFLTGRLAGRGGQR